MGDTLSQTEWKGFIESPLWAAFLHDLDEREKYLFELFREGDLQWSPDFIKGKLTEIEFFRKIPELIVASILIEEANKANKEKNDAEKDWNSKNL